MTMADPVTGRESAVAEALAETQHWHYWPNEYALIGCGYAERGETCPLPDPILAALDTPPALGEDETGHVWGATGPNVAELWNRCVKCSADEESVKGRQPCAATARAHQPTPDEAGDWPCDWPTPHPPHTAESWDDLGRLIGYTEFCHGGNPTAQPTPPAQAEAVAAVEREVRELWAIRWSDGTTSGAMYSDDGSDYAEQTIRVAAGGEEVVHQTETITRTPWEPAALTPERTTP